MSTPHKNSVYGYIRVSTDRQAESGLGVTQQARYLNEHAKQLAKRKGLTVGKVYKDEGVSAKRHPLVKRPQGWELDNVLKAGDHVVIAKLDRAFRSQKDCVLTLERWLAKGVVVIMLDLGVDTSTPVGKVVTGILSTIAEFESDRIGERIRDSRKVMRSRSLSQNGGETIGYRRRGRKLVADPKERKVIHRIRQLRDKSKLYFHQIASKLNAAGERRRKKNNRDRGGLWNSQACWRAYYAKF